MKQKLANARGMLADPRVVLYDEPTRSLDPFSVHNIRSWLAANRSPHTSHLIATNQLPEAEQLCDRVLILNRGVVIASGTIQQIRDTWRRNQHLVHRITCRKFAANGLLRPIPAEGLLELVQEDSDGDCLTLRARTIEGSEALSRLLERILHAGGGILRCQTEEAPFEEVFRALVLEDQAVSRAAPGGTS
jgi:ABC-2 type transport system ATP-binding protein